MQPNPPFEELGLNIEDNEGNIRPALEIAAAARTAAEAGNFKQAFWQMLSLVMAAVEHGLPTVAAELLDNLRSLVPSDAMAPEQRAWLLNAEGLTIGGAGRHRDALSYFSRMLDMGRAIGDIHITSTALQNLGAYHFRLGEYDQARQYYRQSAQEKLEVKDYRGVAQVMLNSATLDEAEGNLDSAEQTLDTLDDLLQLAAGAEPHLNATVLGMRGVVTAKRGDPATAERIFRRALRYARQSDSVDTEVRCMRNIARALQDQGNTKGALRWFRRAIERADNLQVVATVADLHQSIAALLYSMGRRDEAVTHLRTAQQLASQTDDTLWWARITSDLGAVALAEGDVESAKEMLVSLPDIFRQYGDIKGETRALRTLFNLAVQERDVQQGNQYLDRALALVPDSALRDRAGLYRYAAQTLLDGHAPAEYAEALFERGLKYMEQALQQEEAGVLKSSVAWYSVQAAVRLRDDGDHEKAIPFFQKALELYQQSGEQQLAFHIRSDLANAYTETKQFDQAQEQYDKCFALAAQLNDRVMELRTTLNMAEMLSRLDRFDEALRMIERGLLLAQALGDLVAEADLLSNKGSVLVDMLALDAAETAFKAAREIAHNISDEPSAMALLERITAGLANVEVLRKHYRRAARLYLRAADIRREMGPGGERNLLESLGAVMECYSALGDEENTQIFAQQVVTLAQKTGDYEVVYKHTARSARWWVDRRQYEEAASLYAISILVAMADSFRAHDSALWYAEVLKAAYVVVAFVEEAQLPDKAEFYERVIAEAERQHAGTGDITRDAISVVLETLSKPNRGKRRRRQPRSKSK